MPVAVFMPLRIVTAAFLTPSVQRSGRTTAHTAPFSSTLKSPPSAADEPLSEIGVVTSGLPSEGEQPKRIIAATPSTMSAARTKQTIRVRFFFTF